MKTRKLIYMLLLAISIAYTFILVFFRIAVLNYLVPLLLFIIFFSTTGLVYVYKNSKRLFLFSKIFLLMGITGLIIAGTILVMHIPFDLNIVSSISFFVVLIACVCIIAIKNKSDVFVLIACGICVIGFIFKVFRFPGGGILMVLGFGGGAILSTLLIHEKIIEYESHVNRKLNFFKNFVLVTLILCNLATLFRFQHLPGGYIMEITSLMLVIITILCIVFLLPNSNFVEWTKQHKLMFYRSLLIPIIFFASLFSLSYVFPETFLWLFTESKIDEVFYMLPYTIPQ